MPQGPGTYGSQRGRPPKKESGFKLRSGNTTPFKQMGSSPLKQTEAIEHWKKYKAHQRLLEESRRVPTVSSSDASRIKGRTKFNPKSGTYKKVAKKGFKKAAGQILKRIAGPVGAGLLGWDIGRVAHRMIRKKQSLGEALKGQFWGDKTTTKHTTERVGTDWAKSELKQGYKKHKYQKQK